MLSHDDRRRLAEIERETEFGDPRFARRMRRLAARSDRRHRGLGWWSAAAVPVWVLALVSPIAGVAAALVLAMAFVVYWWVPRRIQ